MDKKPEKKKDQGKKDKPKDSKKKQFHGMSWGFCMQLISNRKRRSNDRLLFIYNNVGYLNQKQDADVETPDMGVYQ